MKTKNTLWFCLLLAIKGFSQDDPSPFKFWQLTSYSGQATLRGNFRQSISKNQDNIDKYSASFASGSLSARTKSYFIHPNFMEVSAGGTYNPVTSRQYYVNVPDFAEKSQTQGVDASAIFLKQKNLNFSTSASLYSTVSNIQNLTRVRGTNRTYTAGMNWANKILPVFIGYGNSKSDQTTIGSNRTFKNESKNFSASVNKSFSKYDNTSMFYAHNENTSTQFDDGFVAPIRTTMLADYFSIANSLSPVRWASLSSSLTTGYTGGSFHNNSISGSEGLSLKLPKRFALSNSYGWGITRPEGNKITNREIQSTLTHQLFESLNSRAFFRNTKSDQIIYQQENNTFGLDFRYIKKIPQGTLNIAYIYNKIFQKVITPQTVINIYKEPHVLDSALVVMLNNTNININSVVVKDVTGTIIYLMNIDYILSKNDPYVEIIWKPGGLIPKGATVYVDYSATKAGLYKYNGQSNMISINTSLYNGLLSLYYNVSWQGFNSASKSDVLVLDNQFRHALGARVNYKNTKGGIDYTYVSSNIFPYQGMHYFIQYHTTFKGIYMAVNGDLQDMAMTLKKFRKQQATASINMAYTIVRRVNIRADCAYSKWLGQEIDMYFTTTRVEVSYALQRFSLALGSDFLWNRNGFTKINYRGVYIQLSRNF